VSQLFGRFGNTTGRPYIEGRLVFPGLGNLTANVSFLVDTGADVTTLMPADGVVVGVDYSQLTTKREIGGMGGISVNYMEPALAVFSEEAVALHCYVVQVCMVPPRPEMMQVPSLLGRDILDRWRMVYSPTEGELAFEVKGSDLSVDVGIAVGDDVASPPIGRD
jgi:hypothetical protein